MFSSHTMTIFFGGCWWAKEALAGSVVGVRTAWIDLRHVSQETGYSFFPLSDIYAELSWIEA